MKKNNLALYALFIAGLFSLFTTNIFAQKIDTQTKQCSGEKFVMPPTIAVNSEAFADFIKIASLPVKERRELFSSQSNEQKANFIKVNLATQFVKRPDMTKEQKEFVLDAISKVSADIYDKSDPEKIRRSEQSGREIENRALGLFAHKDLGDFIEPLMTDKNKEINLLQQYEQLLSKPMNVRKKLIYQSTPSEKSDFWKVQMVYHLSTAKLNKNQFDFIVDLLPFFTAKSFDLPETSDQPKNEETLLLDSFEQKALQIFSKEEVFAIFASFGLHKEVRSLKPNVENDLRPPLCECNAWCGVTSVCDGGSCRATTSGCGWSGNTPCVASCT